MISSRTWRRGLAFPKGVGIEAGSRMLSLLLREFDVFMEGIDGIGSAGIHDLRLVVDELAANVLRHASASGDAVLEIEAVRDGEGVLLRVRDNGAAFNPFDQADPYLGRSVRRRAVGGIGLHFIRTLFPEGKYSREGGWNAVEVRRNF